MNQPYIDLFSASDDQEKHMNRFADFFKPLKWCMALVLAAVVAGCGGGGGGGGGTGPGPSPGPVDPVGAVCTQGAACVPLGSQAGQYVILANSGVSTTGTSAITGHVALNAAAVGLTGFSETMDASGTFSTSPQVTGRLYASDYAPPTPAELTQATATDASAAFADADAKLNSGAGFVNVGAGNLTAMTLAPGVYEWSTGVSVDAASTVTLAGSATDVWVFKIAGGITMNPGATVTLTGALPQNVFWRTAGVAALDTTSNLKGIVLSGSSVTLASGATVNGRLIATTAVTLISNTVTRPAP